MTEAKAISVIHVVPARHVADGVLDYQFRLVREMQGGHDGRGRHRQLGMRQILARPWPRGQIFHLQLPMHGWRTNPLVFLVPILLRLRVRRAVIVLTLHEWGDNKLLRRIVNFPVLAFVDRVIVPSLDIAQELHALPLLRRLAPLRDIAIVPIGPNLEWTGNDDQVPHQADGGRRIGYFGFIYSGKRPFFLLEVLGGLLASGITATLVMVGDFLPELSEDRKAFEEAVRKGGFTDRVEWHGYVEDPDLAVALLASCDMFLLPNARGFKDRNGSVITCLQFGKPVIASAVYNRSQLPDWAVELTETGLLRLVDDRSGSAPVIEIIAEVLAELAPPNGAKRTRFDLWERIARAHERIYKQCVDENAP